jgi:hypothetical protein
LRGDKIILETTRADYLSISGIEVFKATCTGNGCGGLPTLPIMPAMSPMVRSTTRTIKSSSTPGPSRMGGFGMGGMVKMGGFGMPMGGSMSFSMGSSKATFNQGSATQGPKEYNRRSFPASNAFSMGSKFTHTQAQVGSWWKASF